VTDILALSAQQMIGLAVVILATCIGVALVLLAFGWAVGSSHTTEYKLSDPPPMWQTSTTEVTWKPSKKKDPEDDGKDDG
jgi:hypothetical protein